MSQYLVKRPKAPEWKNRPRPARPGEVFGRLTVVCFLPSTKNHGKRLCRCNCGNTKEVFVHNLTKGHTTSCGCLTADRDKFRPHKVPTAAHRLVRLLFEEMNIQRCTLAEMVKRSGVPKETFTGWKRYTMPKLDNIDACLQVLGLRLDVRNASKRAGVREKSAETFADRRGEHQRAQTAHELPASL